MTSSSSVKSASTVSLHSTGSVPVRSSSPARSRGWHVSSFSKAFSLLCLY